MIKSTELFTGHFYYNYKENVIIIWKDSLDCTTRSLNHKL